MVSSCHIRQPPRKTFEALCSGSVYSSNQGAYLNPSCVFIRHPQRNEGINVFTKTSDALIYLSVEINVNPEERKFNKTQKKITTVLFRGLLHSGVTSGKAA